MEDLALPLRRQELGEAGSSLPAAPGTVRMMHQKLTKRGPEAPVVHPVDQEHLPKGRLQLLVAVGVFRQEFNTALLSELV